MNKIFELRTSVITFIVVSFISTVINIFQYSPNIEKEFPIFFIFLMILMLSIFSLLSIFYRNRAIEIYNFLTPLNYLISLNLFLFVIFFGFHSIFFLPVLIFMLINMILSIIICTTHFPDLDFNELGLIFNRSKKINILISPFKRNVLLFDIGRISFELGNVVINDKEYDFFELKKFLISSNMKLDEISEDDLTLFEMTTI